jgi:hypothetical protein
MHKLLESEINQVVGGCNCDEENQVRVIECSYWAKTALLIMPGSWESCPTSYSDISKNSNITIIDRRIQDGYFELALEIPLRYRANK